MKWIGQNIQSFISRFRQKVYIESGDMEISKVSGQPTLELSGWSTTATTAHAGRIKFLKSGTATIDTYTAGNHTTAGEILGRIEAYGIDDGDGETLSSYIEFANDAISDADSSPGKIVFATSDADDAGTPTVRLTIDDDGLSTFVGAVSVGGNLTFNSVALTGIQTSAESFSDDDVSIMTSAAIDDRINTAVTAEDLDVAGDSGTAAVDLNSQSLTVTGGTGVTTSATGQAVTINVDAAQTQITSVGTIGTGVWQGTAIATAYIADDAVTFPKMVGSSPNVYGSTIKILPSDFIANDEGSIGVAFDDDANTGMVLEDTASEMWAFVAIPEGMTATAVNIYSNNTARDYFVYEMDINVNGLGSSLGDAKLNTAITGLDVDSTATNFLAIKLDLSATNQRIRGGLVTIAPQ